MRSLLSSSDPSLSLSPPWHSAPLPAADTQKHPVAAEEYPGADSTLLQSSTPSHSTHPEFALSQTGNCSCGFECVAPTQARRSVKGDLSLVTSGPAFGSHIHTDATVGYVSKGLRSRRQINIGEYLLSVYLHSGQVKGQCICFLLQSNFTSLLCLEFSFGDL